MTDFLRECNSGDLLTDAKSFQEVWCARCRRSDCDLAKWKVDRFSQRVAEQPDRIFNAARADATLPQYAQIAAVDFPSLLQKALRLEIASRRNDWTIPEVPIVDGQTIVADESTTQHLDEAVRRLSVGRGRPEPLPSAEEDPEEDPTPPEELPEPPPVAEPAPMHPKAAVVIPQARPNVEQASEMMVDGSPVPSTPPAAEVDPWAPKQGAPVLKAKPGAKIRFGLTGAKVVDD